MRKRWLGESNQIVQTTHIVCGEAKVNSAFSKAGVSYPSPATTLLPSAGYTPIPHFLPLPTTSSPFLNAKPGCSQVSLATQTRPHCPAPTRGSASSLQRPQEVKREEVRPSIKKDVQGRWAEGGAGTGALHLGQSHRAESPNPATAWQGPFALQACFLVYKMGEGVP